MNTVRQPFILKAAAQKIDTLNVSSWRRPDRHYMVDLGMKLEKNKAMIDHGQYFTINRARQYRKQPRYAHHLIWNC